VGVNFLIIMHWVVARDFRRELEDVIAEQLFNIYKQKNIEFRTNEFKDSMSNIYTNTGWPSLDYWEMWPQLFPYKNIIRKKFLSRTLEMKYDSSIARKWFRENAVFIFQLPMNFTLEDHDYILSKFSRLCSRDISKSKIVSVSDQQREERVSLVSSGDDRFLPYFFLY